MSQFRVLVALLVFVWTLFACTQIQDIFSSSEGKENTGVVQESAGEERIGHHHEHKEPGGCSNPDHQHHHHHDADPVEIPEPYRVQWDDRVAVEQSQKARRRELFAALSSFDTGNIQEAVSVLGQISEKEPADGISLEARERLEDIGKYLVAINRGRVARSKGEWEESMHAYLEAERYAREIGPRAVKQRKIREIRADILFDRGLAAYEREEHEEAVQFWLTALILNRDHEQALDGITRLEGFADGLLKQAVELKQIEPPRSAVLAKKVIQITKPLSPHHVGARRILNDMMIPAPMPPRSKPFDDLPDNTKALLTQGSLDAETLERIMRRNIIEDRLAAAAAMGRQDSIPVGRKVELLLFALEAEIEHPAYPFHRLNQTLPYPDDVRNRYLSYLVELGEAAKPPLRQALKHATPFAKEHLLVALAELRDESVLPEVGKLISESKSPAIRIRAARVVGSYSLDDHVRHLSLALSDNYVSREEGCSYSEVVFPVREWAARALEESGYKVIRGENYSYQLEKTER